MSIFIEEIFSFKRVYTVIILRKSYLQFMLYMDTVFSDKYLNPTFH